MIILTPAYGRDYKSADDAKSDYLAGKDFILNDITSPWFGKPCSIRDFPAQEVKIRFDRSRKSTFVSDA